MTYKAVIINFDHKLVDFWDSDADNNEFPTLGALFESLSDSWSHNCSVCGIDGFMGLIVKRVDEKTLKSENILQIKNPKDLETIMTAITEMMDFFWMIPENKEIGGRFIDYINKSDLTEEKEMERI